MNLNRVKLINCSTEILESILKGDDYLSEKIGVDVPEKWTEFGEQVFEYALNKVRKDPDSKKWWVYLPIEIESNTLIGSCGYKGKPDENGLVEIGYEVAEAYRNKGYATEIVKLLTKIAFDDDQVKGVIVHTFADENTSVKVLKKCDFVFVKELFDEEDGLIWEWKLEK